MRDSLTYQAILAEGEATGLAKGRVEGDQEFLLHLGTMRLGPADRSIQTRIKSITDVDVLKRLGERMLTASSWAELFANEP